MHDYGINFQEHNLQNFFEWQGGSHTIKNIFANQKIYKKLIKNLSKLNLIFIDQIINQNNKLLLNWQVLLSLINSYNKRCPPM